MSLQATGRIIRNALGGVELTVEEPISVGLDGLEALAYVRYRGGPTADIGRIAHQQKFLSAITREATSPSKVLRWPVTLGAIRDNTKTNMNFFEVARYVIRTGVLTGLLGGSAEVKTYPGAPQYIGGVAYWVPEKDAAAPLIDETIK